MSWQWVSGYDYKGLPCRDYKKVQKKNKKGGEGDHDYWSKNKYKCKRYKRWQDEDEWDNDAEEENDDEDAEYHEPEKRPRPPLQPPRQERETTEDYYDEETYADEQYYPTCTMGMVQTREKGIVRTMKKTKEGVHGVIEVSGWIGAYLHYHSDNFLGRGARQLHMLCDKDLLVGEFVTFYIDGHHKFRTQSMMPIAVALKKGAQ